MHRQTLMEARSKGKHCGSKSSLGSANFELWRSLRASKRAVSLVWDANDFGGAVEMECAKHRGREPLFVVPNSLRRMGLPGR